MKDMKTQYCNKASDIKSFGDLGLSNGTINKIKAIPKEIVNYITEGCSEMNSETLIAIVRMADFYDNFLSDDHESKLDEFNFLTDLLFGGWEDEDLKTSEEIVNAVIRAGLLNVNISGLGEKGHLFTVPSVFTRDSLSKGDMDSLGYSMDLPVYVESPPATSCFTDEKYVYNVGLDSDKEKIRKILEILENELSFFQYQMAKFDLINQVDYYVVVASSLKVYTNFDKKFKYRNISEEELKLLYLARSNVYSSLEIANKIYNVVFS